MKTQIFVMPAWIAGTQIRRDAFGNIHVNLDSSTPCWNDASRCLNQARLLRFLFSRENFTGLRSLPRLPGRKRKRRRGVEQLDPGVQLDKTRAAQLSASGQ